jgi:hypothetical protein
MTADDRHFVDWIRDLDAMAGQGYRPVLIVLRNEDDEIRLLSPVLGPELASIVSACANEAEPGPPVESCEVPRELEGERDDDLAELVAQLEDAHGRGMLPCWVLFMDDADRVHSLADPRIENLASFLRWLSFEVAKAGDDAE